MSVYWEMKQENIEMCRSSAWGVGLTTHNVSVMFLLLFQISNMKCMYSSVRAGCVGGEFVSLEATWEGLKI